MVPSRGGFAPLRGLALGFVLTLVSAAQEPDAITVEDDPDGGVVVRSPMAQANFLFRAPPGFRKGEPPEGFAVALERSGGEGTARIRLRLGRSDGAAPDALAKAREAEYRAGYGDLEVVPQGGRALARTRGEAGARRVLVVVDGSRTYELFLEAAPADSALEKQLDAVAAGFTILDPQGPPPAAATAGDAAAASIIEHEYYRLKVLKPAGFEQLPVDPGADKGIVLLLRREDAERNLCEIRVRVHLASSLKTSPEELAQTSIEAFARKHPPAKVPRRPGRASWPGANAASQFKLAGKMPSGAVVEEEWRVIDHSNDRVYEVQVTLYAGASRAFKKELQAFWRGLKIAAK
jgi:hypothetical protein